MLNTETFPQTMPPHNSAGEAPTSVTPEERERMIAEAAYYRAEKRGFANADPRQDWLEAEAEIDAMLYGPPPADPEKPANAAAAWPDLEDLAAKHAFEQKREAQLKKWDAKVEELRAKAKKKK